MHSRNAALILCAAMMISFVLIAPNAHAQSDTFVRIAPCRIFNTATDAVAGEEASRSVDVRASRCGRIIPSFATAYSVSVVIVGKESPEKLPPVAGPVRETSRRIPAPAIGNALVFPIPQDRYLAVDIDGYWVSSSTPVRPSSVGTSSESTPTSAPVGTPRPGVPTANVVHSGDKGEIYLDATAPNFPQGGVVMVAAADKPWVVAKTGTATAASGFQIVNSANEVLLTARGDGPLKLPGDGPTAYIDGATDFFGVPNADWYSSVPMNTIHNVALLSPRDSAGGSTSRVVFFNSETHDEYGSPAITKYRAFTLGYYGQLNVNFDSWVRYHNPNQIHYRARSSLDQGADTFWVRAGADPNGNHKADMYVSGKVGVGTTSPVHSLDVAGSATIGTGYTTITTVPANGLIVEGNVGIGVTNPQHKLHVNGSIHATEVIGASYQDLAEWVPVTADLSPGTVVVLDVDASNTVRASASPYDTTVAGVVSAQPGVILGVAGASKEMIATTGRVRVKVDATTASVKIGDLLVTSGKPGTAMKSVPVDVSGISMHRPGTIIGKALEPLPSGEGEILVLLSLQ